MNIDSSSFFNKHYEIVSIDEFNKSTILVVKTRSKKLDKKFIMVYKHSRASQVMDRLNKLNWENGTYLEYNEENYEFAQLICDLIIKAE